MENDYFLMLYGGIINGLLWLLDGLIWLFNGLLWLSMAALKLAYNVGPTGTILAIAGLWFCYKAYRGDFYGYNYQPPIDDDDDDDDYARYEDEERPMFSDDNDWYESDSGIDDDAHWR